jgi:glycine/D-amino acid oxidase-like deaminating enzyme
LISRDLLSGVLRRRRPHDIWSAPETAPESCDVAVVGGGVRALGVARACAEAGAKVALFASGEIAAAGDERAWPVVRAAHADKLRSATDAEAPQLLRRLARRLGRISTDMSGALTLAEDVEALGRAAARIKADGAGAWMVPEREVAALSPPLAGFSHPALYEQAAITVDADALALALAGAAVAAGARLFAGLGATALERDGPAATGLMLGERAVRAGAIVLADDFAAIRLIREGKGRLSLTREERVTLVTSGGAPAIGPALAVDDLRISRDHAGALSISGPLGADALARRLVGLAPALAGLTVTVTEPVTVWTGVDGLPQVGAAGIDGVWLALGYGREALSLALPAAEHLAAAMAGGRGSRAFEPFAPTRGPGLRLEELVR